MNKIKVLKIPLIKDVYAFVEKCCESADAASIYATRGRIEVPCTSILGMFSLDTSTPFAVSYPDSKATSEFEKFISQFVIASDEIFEIEDKMV